MHIEHNIQFAITNKYDCYQNTLAESIDGILKMEYLLIKSSNLKQAN